MNSTRTVKCSLANKICQLPSSYLDPSIKQKFLFVRSYTHAKANSTTRIRNLNQNWHPISRENRAGYLSNIPRKLCTRTSQKVLAKCQQNRRIDAFRKRFRWTCNTQYLHFSISEPMRNACAPDEIPGAAQYDGHDGSMTKFWIFSKNLPKAWIIVATRMAFGGLFWSAVVPCSPVGVTAGAPPPG